jgi:acyl-coenzyme A thioesterase 13
MSDIPEGYGPLPRNSNFLQMIGPLYCKPESDGLILGLRIDERHINTRGTAHGGLLTTLADLALGYNCGRAMEFGRTLITTSITIDFIASAAIGDWLTAHTDLQQAGKRLGFANCYLMVGDKRIARASGIFSVIERKAA